MLRRIPVRNFVQDLRYALRGMFRRPGYSALVVLTLALGIGANTAIFSVADATLRRGLPYREPDRLVTVSETRPREDFSRMELSYPNYLDVRARSRSFAGLAGHFRRGVTFTGPRGSELMKTGNVTGDFFTMLGVGATLGRTLGPIDDQPDAARVAVLMDGSWQRRFGGDPTVVGRTMSLDGKPVTIVGVLGSSFSFAPFEDAELIVNARIEGDLATRRNLHWFNVVGRLAPGVSVTAAQDELSRIAGELEAEHPDSNAGGGVRAVPLGDEVLGQVRPILMLLLGAVGLVLLVACANVANLVLTRHAGREKELAIRAALGASRTRLLALLTVDSLSYALIAGGTGVLLAIWGVDALLGAIPRPILASMPYLALARVDSTALLFGLAVALVSGLAVGLLPALRSSKPLHDKLKEEGRGTPGRARGRLRDALVVSEVAVAFVLLAGAGLVTRSLWRVLDVDPGFEPRGVTTASLNLPDRITEDAEAFAMEDAIVQRVTALPGVEGVATVDILPAGNGGNTIRYVLDGQPRQGGLEPEANIRTVSATYFPVMRVPLVAGRFFDAHERPNTLIVNQSLARRVFGGDAVGKRIVFTFAKGQPAREIVGVVGDERLGPFDKPAVPAIYAPSSTEAMGSFAVLVRGRVGGDDLARAIGSVDSAMPVYGIGTIVDRIERQPWMFVRRFPAILVGAFAGLALLLSTIGMYGVLSYSVRQRTQEISIRRAVGAQSRHIAGMLLGRSALLAGIGVAIGLAISLATTRLLGSLLFGVSPSDPATLAASAGLLLAVALAASWLPARGALAIDPMQALR